MSAGHTPLNANSSAALAHVEAWVRGILEANHRRAHGWLHTVRVRANIRRLARSEGVDPFLAELAALLHDVGRTEPGPETEHGARSADLAAPLLAELPLTEEERSATLHAIRWHNSLRADTPLLCILRDADMLDGLGAMGLIRAFMSKSHLPPYDAHAPFEEGKGRWPPSYSSDQLLGQMEWFGRLNTDEARRMAQHRIAFMQAFLVQARVELAESGG